MADTKETPPPEYTTKSPNHFPAPNLPLGLPSSSTTNTPSTAPPRATTAIITLRHCDGSVVKRGPKDAKGPTFAGKALSTINIAVKISATTNYEDILSAIYERVEDMWSTKMDTRKTLYRGLNLLVDSKSVFIKDSASWEPCRDLLLDGKGTLSFSFWETKDAESEREGGGEGRKKSGKCRVQ
ncbi:hypothetical protein Tdes44962_MAKER01277 [Teratosphaeria destructans]|uniref:Uncharacterized protein n=1 Tax=Teratosphaeria destructans TaxID=418781 RepID=A0A9W7W6V3_9PEZI|nr:hypothetical protein Tdes44962_MAKER01277 [Teratosphaeria destructans]